MQLRREARQALVQRTVVNVVAVDWKMIGEVFHVLRWTSRDLDRTVTVLLEEGTVREVAVEGMGRGKLSRVVWEWRRGSYLERMGGLEKRDGRGALRGVDLEP